MRTVRLASHVHSDWSYDGQWTLARISAAFGRRGYDAVLMAEHDRGFDANRWAQYRTACAAVGGTGAMLIPGIEYSDPTNSVHIPVWGDIPFLGESRDTAELLADVERVGGLAVLAHPGRRDVWKQFDPSLLRFLFGVELWNRKYDGYAPSREAMSLIEQRAGIVPVVSLDFHTGRQFHPLAMMAALDGDIGEGSICGAIRQRRLRPKAFRLRATMFSSDPAWSALRRVEWTRKRAAKHVKRLIRSS